jgi:hypothetical protein
MEGIVDVQDTTNYWLGHYQSLLIVWIRMQNWVRVNELIKKISIAHQCLKEEKSRV